jgi:hypothetical protein
MTRHSEERALRERLAIAELSRLRDAGPPRQWPYRAPLEDLSDCRAAYRLRDDGTLSRNWIDIFEPLDANAPSPALAQPHCCYIRTIIFYHRPYICSPWRKLWRGAGGRLKAERSCGHFEQWGAIDYRLAAADLVEFDGDRFEVTSGRVLWTVRRGDPLGRRWWMHHGARRVGA